MLFLSFLDPVKNEISNKITFARPGVSVFGALHCMSCSSCLLSAKILHMQIHMLHLGSGCMLVQQVRLPHSWPVNRSREVVNLIGAERLHFPQGLA